MRQVFGLSEYEFDVLKLGMSQIKNREALEGFNVSAYPHMEDKSRDKIHRETYKIAFPKEFEKSIVTSDQLGNLGIDVGNISDYIKD